jgi:hypothetical protein
MIPPVCRILPAGKIILIWVYLFSPAECGPMEYSPRYGHLRSLLRTIREEAGLSQLDLAERLGKPQSFVCKSELGERRIDFLETLDFCDACGFPVAEFARRLDKVGSGSGAKNSQRRARGRKPHKLG